MKTRAVTWMIALALAGTGMSQQTDEVRRFNEQYEKSLALAIAAYPDFGKAESPLYKRLAEIDEALRVAGDPLFESADKPLILARRAAKELGIKPVETKPDQNPLPQAPVEVDGKVIPELNGYLSVTIRRVEPDGLRIIHESGTAKIPIEKLTDAQRAEYGLSAEGAAQYRKQSAENAATTYARQQEAARNQAEAPRAPAVAPTAKFITAAQVKAVWVKKLPQPRSLDPNYSKIMESYREFVGEIRAGKRDLDAQETAATYNKAKAVEIGNNELAANYEAELGRISEAKSAAAALAQQQKQARRDAGERARLNAELMSIDRNLRDIRNTIQGW